MHGCGGERPGPLSPTAPQATAPPPSTAPSAALEAQPVLALTEATKHVGNWTIDQSAFVGLPRTVAAAASAYIQGALPAFPAGAPRRSIYKRKDATTGPGFPLDVAWELVGTEPAPIVLLPTPEQVRAALQRNGAHPGFNTSPVLGRSLLFTPGTLSDSPIHALALPSGSRLSAGIFKYNPPHAKLGKIVLGGRDSENANSEPLSPLRIGKLGGASVDAWLRTMPVFPDNPVLRLVQLERPGQPPVETLSYAIADANGARRGSAFVLPNGASTFAKGLESPEHDPVVGKHSLLRIPTPIALGGQDAPHEELALDEWFAQADPPIFALVLSPTSSPFREDYVLQQLRPGASLAGEVVQIIVFASIQPRDLIAGMRLLAPSMSPATADETGLLNELASLRKAVGGQ